MISLKTDCKTILIENLTIEDPRAYRHLSKASDEARDQKISDALSLGFLILEKTAAIEESDWVSQRLQEHILMMNYRLEQQANQIMGSLREQFDAQRAGSLIAPINDALSKTQQELAQKLKQTVEQIDAEHTKLKGVMQTTFDMNSKSSQIQLFTQQLAQIIGSLEQSIDPKRDGTSLREFLNRFEALSKETSSAPAIQEKIDVLRDEIKQMVTEFKSSFEAQQSVERVQDEYINSSPLKGLVFEDLVKDQLKHIADIRNDLIESVGTQPGKGTSKKGDLVYYISQTKSRIVYELKDYSSKFTFQKIRDLIEESKANRDALYGVFLVKDESCLPDGIGKFYITEDFCITTQEFLETATKIAILISHQKIARMASTDGPDWMFIETNIQDVKATIEELSELESGCASAQKAITKTADGVRRISRALNEKVEVLLSEISKKESA